MEEECRGQNDRGVKCPCRHLCLCEQPPASWLLTAGTVSRARVSPLPGGIRVMGQADLAGTPEPIQPHDSCPFAWRTCQFWAASSKRTIGAHAVIFFIIIKQGHRDCPVYLISRAYEYVCRVKGRTHL